MYGFVHIQRGAFFFGVSIMRFRILALLLVMLAFTVQAPPAVAGFRVESIDNDIPGEIDAAAKDGKNLVVFFNQTGCPYCDMMRKRVFPAAKIVDYFSQHFVMIDSNIRGGLDVVMPDGSKGTERDLARKLRIRATPVIVFFDRQRKIALKTTGYLNVDLFYLAGKYVAENVYKTKKSFFRYVQEQR